MKENEVREPIQKRSIEKKRRIIEAGFKLFCENGYHKTNTVEIAKEAGVSTGIVYNYFKDKKAILLESILLFRELLTEPLYAFMTTSEPPVDLETLVESLLETIVAGHHMAKDAHEEMMAMSHADEDVAKLLHDFEMQTTKKIASILFDLGFGVPHMLESVQIAICLMENYCHEVLFHKRESIDYNALKSMTVKQVVYLFSPLH